MLRNSQQVLLEVYVHSIDRMLQAINSTPINVDEDNLFTSSVVNIDIDGNIDMIWGATYDGTTASRLSYYGTAFKALPIAKLNI